MNPWSWIPLGMSVLALVGSVTAYWMTQGTWLLLAKTERAQAETWAMLDRYDRADQCLADAAKYERWAWPRRQKASAA